MSRSSLSLSTVVLTSILFFGCTDKQYYVPAKVQEHTLSGSSYAGNIVDLTRDGATLDNGNYINKSGVSHINLGEGYRFLSESDKYVLAANTDGVLNLIDKKHKKSVRAISLHTPVVSATIRNGIVAYILNNNTFGIYRVSDNKKIVESRSSRTFAVDTRAASPMFIENLVVMPMLDGKLIIVDSNDSDNTKVVYLSSEKVFNNVVNLSRVGETMLASTPKRIMTLGENGKEEYRANISEIAINKNSIYVFTKEGKITKLSASLKHIASRKFKFAHFSAATAFSNKVYALDQQGSLIVLSSNLKKSKVYDIGAVEKPVYISGTKLYKDGKIIELSKLGYE